MNPLLWRRLQPLLLTVLLLLRVVLRVEQVAAVAAVAAVQTKNDSWLDSLPFPLDATLMTTATTTTSTSSSSSRLPRPLPLPRPHHQRQPQQRRNFHDAAWRMQRLAREPLVNWLDQLQVHIPDQSFTAQLIAIHIRNLTCTHFRLDGHHPIESRYIPSSSTTGSNTTNSDTTISRPPVLELVVPDIEASCQGIYAVTGGVGGQVTAKMGATQPSTAGPADSFDAAGAAAAAAATAAALEWNLAILDQTNTTRTVSSSSVVVRQPSNVSTLSCASHLAVTEIHFFGSLSAKLIDLFATSIRHAVNDAVQGQICTNLASVVDPLLTSYLQTALQWLQPYLTPPSHKSNNNKRDEARHMEQDGHNYVFGPPDMAPNQNTGKNDSTLLRFDTDVPVFYQTLQAVNAFVGDHLERGFLSSSVFDTCGGFANGWNGVSRQLLWLNNGTFTVPHSTGHVHAVIPHYAAMNLTIHNVTLAGDGLSQWTEMALFNPVNGDASTLSNRFETTGPVRVTSSVTLQLTTVPGGMFQGDTLVESFVVHVDVTSLAAAVNLSLALDKELFQHLTIETLLAAIWRKQQHHSLDCLMECVRSVAFHGLSLQTQVTGIMVDPVTGDDDSSLSERQGVELTANQDLEHDIDVLINNIMQLILTEYQSLVTEAIHGLTQGPVQNRINQWFDKIIVNATTPDVNCSANPAANQTDNDSPPVAHWVNFSLVQPLHQLNTFLKKPSTLSKLNRYLDCAADQISAFIRERMDHVSYIDADILTHGPADTVSSLLRLKNFYLANVGGIEELVIWQPDSEGYHLQSSFQSGNLNSSSAMSRPELFASMGIDQLAFQNLSAEVNITIYFDEISWDAISMIHFDGKRLQKASLLNVLSNGLCALTPLTDFDISTLTANLGFFQALANVTVNMESGSLDLSFDSLTVDYVQSTISTAIVWMTESLRDLLQAAAKTTLLQSQSTCTAETNEIIPDDSTPRDADEVVNMNSILLILAAVFVFAQPAILLIQRRKDQEATRNSVDLTEPLLNPVNTSDANVLRNRSNESDGLMFQPSVPTITRFLVPTSILVVIVLLLASNLSVGATVDMVVSIEGNVFRLPPLFGFSLLNTARDMFQAGIYPLFFLVVGFSGVWPYAKLVIMLNMWTSPKRLLSLESRGKLLLKLDALSKFSLVDTYVLVVMLVAFRYHLKLLDGMELDVYVTPQFGFFGFLFATSASLVIGHWMVFEHRRSIIQEATPVTQVESLFSHNFRFQDGSEGRFSLLFRTFVLSSLLSIVLLLSIGMVQESFIFEFGGLAGFALQDQYRTSHSLISFGSSLPTSVETTTGIGIQVLRAVFYFYAVVTPFATLVLVTIVLVWPMSAQKQFQFLTAAEIANAWSATEVFGLSIVAAMFEISTFADFIIGHRCDFIDKVLNTYGNGFVTTCYTVKSSVSWNVVYLLVGAAMNSCWVTYVIRMLQAYMSERLLQGDDELALDHAQTLSQVIHSSRFKSWILRSEDDPVNISTAGNDVSMPSCASEASPVSPWQEEDSFSSEWNEAAERDPTWKEWKEATNVI